MAADRISIRIGGYILIYLQNVFLLLLSIHFAKSCYSIVAHDGKYRHASLLESYCEHLPILPLAAWCGGYQALSWLR